MKQFVLFVIVGLFLVLHDATGITVSANDEGFVSGGKVSPRTISHCNDTLSNILNEGCNTNETAVEPTATPPLMPRKYTIFLSKTGVAIYNNGVFNTGTKRDSAFQILMDVKAEGFDEKTDPYKGVYIVGRVIEGDISPVGFHLEGSSILSSNVKKKTQGGLADFLMMTKGTRAGARGGLVFNPNQKVEFVLQDAGGKELSNKVVFMANLEDAAPKITVNPKGATQVQAGFEGGFTFRITDPDSKKLDCIVETSIGSIKLKDSGWQTYATMPCEPDVNIQVGYKAPEIGNFDIGSELSGLSMWSEQKETMKTFGKDLIGLGVEKGIEKGMEAMSGLETAKKIHFRERLAAGMGNKFADPQKTSESLEAAQEAYKSWDTLQKFTWGKYGYTLIDGGTGLYTAAKGDIPQGVMAVTHTQGKTGLEKVSDFGVAGITMVQTAVGTITLVTDKIPLLGQATGKFTLAFNAATNIWKGNLNYISKVEKMNRAEERFMQAAIRITVKDDTGFRVRELKVFTIAYNLV